MAMRCAGALRPLARPSWLSSTSSPTTPAVAVQATATALGSQLGAIRAIQIVSRTEPRKKKPPKFYMDRTQKKPDGLRMPKVGPVISGRQLIPPRFLAGIPGRLASAIWARSASDKLPGLMQSRDDLEVVLQNLASSQEGQELYKRLESTLESTNLDASEEDLRDLETHADGLGLGLPVLDTLKDMVLAGVFNMPTLKQTTTLYKSLILAALRVQEVEVTSAKSLTEDEKMRVRVGLQTSNLSILPAYGKVEIDYRVDPEIEAGYKIHFPRDNQTYDLSLASRHKMLEWIARRGY